MKQDQLGLEALIALDALVCTTPGTMAAEEESDYGDPTRLEQMEARQLLALVRQASDRLLALGLSPQDILAQSQSPQREEPLRITDNYRIFLPQRGNIEIVMRPLVKALFLLFLKHPEGIRFKELSDYRDELGDIYGRISHRSDPEGIRQSVDRLVNPIDNSVNISRSRLSRSLSEYFDNSTLGQYIIQGNPGQPKRIPLNRRYVIWE